MRRVVLLAALFGLLAFALPGSVLAQVVAHISLSTQRMSEALAAKKIDIVGGIYDLATGKVGLI